MEDRLLRYLLDDLTPDERIAVEAQLASDPTAAAKLKRFQHIRATLEAEPMPTPPAGLAVRAIARTAEVLVSEGLYRTPSPDHLGSPLEETLASTVEIEKPRAGRAGYALRRWVGDAVFTSGWRRADAVVAAGIAFLAVGIGLATVSKLRQESQLSACQDNLRQIHSALIGYSDTHDGQFPQVGTPNVPVAGAFATELARNGQLTRSTATLCSAAGDDANGTYVYTLGYRGAGDRVIGLRRPDGTESTTMDWTPIAADPPSSTHPRGLNVLYVGGAVRLSTSSAAGLDGDDIYRNNDGLVRAGLHRKDSSLGRGNDVP